MGAEPPQGSRTPPTGWIRNAPWALSTEIAGALFDALLVVLMRLSAIARCDMDGCRDAQTMVLEAVQAACEAGLPIAARGMAGNVVGLYRGVVRADIDRLSAGPGTPVRA